VVISDTGQERPYTFSGLARTFAPDGEHLITEDPSGVLVYDRQWCGRLLVMVDGRNVRWLGWAGPARVLVETL
jgi:hypothetical protein